MVTSLGMKPLPRKTRVAWDEPGHAHFVTFSCFQRLPLLTKDRTRQWVVVAMEEMRRKLDVGVWAYVVMPEHVHVLFYPRTSTYEMRRILVALKRPVSDAARKHLEDTSAIRWLKRLTVRYPSRTVFRFWQPGGGFDRNIFKEKSVPSVIEYMHDNPVRRGLVSDPLAWRWSSAQFWAGRSDVPIRMDEPFV